MSFVQLLKTLEEVQHKGRQSEKRVQDLEVENHELKKKLVEEEADDAVIVQSWGDRVRVLQNENKELQKRLEDDEEEDSLLVSQLNKRIDELVAENSELKSAIGQLEAQVVMVDSSGHKSSQHQWTDRKQWTSDERKTPIKLDLLKQRINQMVIENDELKSTIGRLRWANQNDKEKDKESPTQVRSDPLESEELESESAEETTIVSQEEDNDLLTKQMEEELNQLRQKLWSEQNESQMWRDMYEKLKNEMLEKMVNERVVEESVDGRSRQTITEEEEVNSGGHQKSDPLNENVDNVYDWVLNSSHVLKEALVSGSGVVADKLRALLDNNQLLRGINATQSVVYDLNSRLQNKWQELQDLKTVLANGNQKISNKMSKLLDKTVRKLREASDKLLTKEEDIERRVNHFSNHITRLIVNLDKKWNNLLNKLSDRYAKQSESSAEESVQQFESSESKINWFFLRAKSRREESQPMSDGGQEVDEKVDDQENWFLRKARKPKEPIAGEESPHHWYHSRRDRLKRSRHFEQSYRYSRHR